MDNGDKAFVQVNVQTLDNATKELSDTEMVSKKEGNERKTRSKKHIG
jgi:hypothetical protein